LVGFASLVCGERVHELYQRFRVDIRESRAEAVRAERAATDPRAA
jgi:hypothetical protein